MVSTHSRSKAAGSPAPVGKGRFYDVSTHSRSKAAGVGGVVYLLPLRRFNTQPLEGGWTVFRRPKRENRVSTHSRSKAAGAQSIKSTSRGGGFNTQPLEGGW